MLLDNFYSPLRETLRSGCPKEFLIEHQPIYYQVQALHHFTCFLFVLPGSE